jgi:hypothetical protein
MFLPSITKGNLNATYRELAINLQSAAWEYTLVQANLPHSSNEISRYESMESC